MNKVLEIEKKISNLVNEFNSQNYQYVVEKAKEIIIFNKNIPIIYNLLGASHSLLNNDQEAIKAFENAVKLEPNNEEVFRNLGKSYTKLNNYDAAKLSFENAIKIKPLNPDAIFGLGLLFLKNKNYYESIFRFTKAIKLKENFYQSYYNLALAQSLIGRFNEAEANYVNAITINKNYFQAFNNLGSLKIKINQSKEAIQILEKAIHIKPTYIEALTNLGVAYLQLKNFKKAKEYFEKVIKLDSTYVRAISQKLYLMRKTCDWTEDNFLEQNLKLIKKSDIEITPWQLLSLDDDPQAEFDRAKKYGSQFSYKDFKIFYNNSKIKIAYFTPDFYDHAGMINMEGIFKYHNKEKFQIYAFDYGHSNYDNTHERIKKYFDHFIYVNKLNDDEIAEIVKEMQIDIVIHRNGYSQNSRNTLFSKKIAPIQISFLGYPGTMGVDFIDYIIADKVVIPENNIKYFSEKIIYLPNTYYPTFNERKISKKKFEKKHYEIDSDTFVFASFNNSYKISRNEFLIWMKLLDTNTNSVLLLLIEEEITKQNLISEIKKTNIDPKRIKFVNYIKNEDHLARHNIVDLYLDTFNYNGHTSSIDSLYSGVPVITKVGNSFTARVCASILNACDMYELVTFSEKEYFELALKISKNKNILENLKFKLKNKLLETTLFNTKKYVQDLEKAYFEAFLNKNQNKAPKNIIIK